MRSHESSGAIHVVLTAILVKHDQWQHRYSCKPHIGTYSVNLQRSSTHISKSLVQSLGRDKYLRKNHLHFL